MVGYNLSLVLQSRVQGFKAEHLHQLLYQDRLLVDAWDKNMAIYPIEDWPYFERYRHEELERLQNRSTEVLSILPELREILHTKGPSSSLDFDFDTIVDWSWAPTKASRAALESLFYSGELIVHNKVGTRRLYDFAHKHLPLELMEQPDPNPSIEAYHEWHVKRRINAVGLLWNKASDAWLGIHWMKTKERKEAFERLIEKGEIVPVEVEGLEIPLYLDKQQMPLFEKVKSGDFVQKKVSFLAPLDNMLWDRKLIQELFGFEYRWEVYKPIVERDYGYYVLPILYGDALIGRFEPVFDKKTKELRILNWWWEEGISLTTELYGEIQEAIVSFKDYLGASNVSFSKEGKSVKVLKDLKKNIL
ncbi:MAG: AlkZ family DNA glycosylase, partial [Vallitaleaceae bacterium]|nr:AlkZ family DNA glycosylase [Vallitaleaceae bacterium]